MIVGKEDVVRKLKKEGEERHRLAEVLLATVVLTVLAPASVVEVVARVAVALLDVFKG